MVTGCSCRALVFAALLANVSGCGVTSISVPVDRPAEIYLQRYPSIVLHIHAHPPDAALDFPVSDLAALITAETGRQFAATVGRPILPAADLAVPIRPDGDVPVARYGELSAATGTPCLLQWHLLEARYDEGVQSAALHQQGAAPAVKNVRMGVLRIRAMVSATDMREHARFWQDTVTALESSQSRASQSVPDGVDSLALLRTAVAAMVAEVAHRATPRREKAVVSFLKDGDYPDIVLGIRSAERGDWGKAVALFAGVARASRGTDDEHRMLHNLGMAQLYGGDYRAAYASFEEALRLKRDSRYEHAMRLVLDMEREAQERERQRDHDR
jgi:hypothetical protein